MAIFEPSFAHTYTTVFVTPKRYFNNGNRIRCLAEKFQKLSRKASQCFGNVEHMTAGGNPKIQVVWFIGWICAGW